jgi:hypothetical protein
MSSDRGTIPRGPAAGADQWAEPTMPAGRRMPGAPRERKPLLVVLALLLIVVGAGAGGLLLTRMTHRIAVIEVVRTVGPGQQFTAADVAQVQIASDSGLSYVSWAALNQLTRDFAATKIPAGTLLTPSMVSAVNNVAGGRDTLGLALKDGQVPGGLQVGQSVMIYSTSTATTGCPGTPGAILASNATVLGIATGKNGSGTTDVEVALDPGAAGAVACNTANGTTALAIMPGNG